MSKSIKKTSPRAASSTKTKAKPAAKDATEKARKAAAAEIAARIDAMPDTDAPPASLHDDTVVRGDGEVVAVSVPANEPEGAPATPAKAPKGKKAKAQREMADKPAKAPKPPNPAKVKKVSGLDAAAMVLAASKAPMKATDMLAEIQKRGLWTSKGKTPEATLYAAIIREIAAKGKDARFKKHDRGLFVAGKGA